MIERRIRNVRLCLCVHSDVGARFVELLVSHDVCHMQVRLFVNCRYWYFHKIPHHRVDVV